MTRFCENCIELIYNQSPQKFEHNKDVRANNVKFAQFLMTLGTFLKSNFFCDEMTLRTIRNFAPLFKKCVVQIRKFCGS